MARRVPDGDGGPRSARSGPTSGSPGSLSLQESTRKYPEGPLAAAVLGYVGTDDQGPGGPRVPVRLGGTGPSGARHGPAGRGPALLRRAGPGRRRRGRPREVEGASLRPHAPTPRSSTPPSGSWPAWRPKPARGAPPRSSSTPRRAPSSRSPRGRRSTRTATARRTPTRAGAARSPTPTSPARPSRSSPRPRRSTAGRSGPTTSSTAAAGRSRSARRRSTSTAARPGARSRSGTSSRTPRTSGSPTSRSVSGRPVLPGHAEPSGSAQKTGIELEGETPGLLQDTSLERALPPDDVLRPGDRRHGSPDGARLRRDRERRRPPDAHLVRGRETERLRGVRSIPRPEPRRVLSEGTARQMRRLLARVVEMGTGKAAAIRATPPPGRRAPRRRRSRAPGTRRTSTSRPSSGSSRPTRRAP